MTSGDGSGREEEDERMRGRGQLYCAFSCTRPLTQSEQREASSVKGFFIL